MYGNEVSLNVISVFKFLFRSNNPSWHRYSHEVNRTPLSETDVYKCDGVLTLSSWVFLYCVLRIDMPKRSPWTVSSGWSTVCFFMKGLHYWAGVTGANWSYTCRGCKTGGANGELPAAFGVIGSYSPAFPRVLGGHWDICYCCGMFRGSSAASSVGLAAINLGLAC